MDPGVQVTLISLGLATNETKEMQLFTTSSAALLRPAAHKQ
jgi:hypothetical protein